MIERVPVVEHGIVGTLFRTTSANSPPAIVLPGSEGGTPEHVAHLLAGDEGIAALALNYFGVSPLPKRLVQVPLEYVEAAAGWLCRQPGVKDTPVILVGGSKGAELALSVAAHLPERFGAVVAVAPSCVVWAGVEFVAKDRRFLAGLFGTASRRSSWSLRGDPLPFLHHAEGVLPAVSHRGISVTRSFTVALDRAGWPNPAAIPVERAHGPILLISGADDRVAVDPHGAVGCTALGGGGTTGPRPPSLLPGCRAPARASHSSPWHRPPLRGHRLRRIETGGRRRPRPGMGRHP
jgi:hypothetical protein